MKHIKYLIINLLYLVLGNRFKIKTSIKRKMNIPENGTDY